MPPLIADDRALAELRRARSPPAPGRSPSTPSAPPATATASAPTWSSCARAGVGSALVDPIACHGPGGARRRRSPTPSGCCTPRARTCPASPRSACARRPSSTPSSPAGWPASSGSASARWSSSCSACAWRRGTRPPTGRAARCPSPGCATPRSTSRSSSSCATRSRPSSRAQGKLDWAHEEFEALVDAPPKEPRADPWRRTSGIHRVRNRRQLAVVRALWEARDDIARSRDIAPGRVLPDASILAAVTAAPADEAALLSVPGFTGRGVRRHAHTFLDAYRDAGRLPDTELPPSAMAYDGPPPAARWSDRDPEAAARLARVRAALATLAESTGCRSRTCSPPTSSAGSPGSRRSRSSRPPSRDGAAGRRRPSLAGRARGRGDHRSPGDPAAGRGCRRRLRPVPDQ